VAARTDLVAQLRRDRIGRGLDRGPADVPRIAASTAWVQVPATKSTVRLSYRRAGPGIFRTALSFMVPPPRLCTSSVA